MTEPTTIVPAPGMIVTFDDPFDEGGARMVASLIPGSVNPDGSLEDVRWTDSYGGNWSWSDIIAHNPLIHTKPWVEPEAEATPPRPRRVPSRRVDDLIAMLGADDDDEDDGEPVTAAMVNAQLASRMSEATAAAVDEDDGELYDDDGYPTDQAVERIATFRGTPADFLAYVTSLYDSGRVSVEDIVNDWGRAQKRVSFVTCGWSGCEQVMGAIDNTMFHFAYWAESHRGGLTVYEIPEAMLDSESFWGRYDRIPAAEGERHKSQNRACHP